MKVYDPKTRGKKLELKFAKMLRDSGLDSKASRQVRSGALWNRIGDIQTDLPWNFELKDQAKIKFWEWWEQAERARKPFRPPALVFSSDFRPIIVSLAAEDFINLLVELKDYREKYG